MRAFKPAFIVSFLLSSAALLWNMRPDHGNAPRFVPHTAQSNSPSSSAKPVLELLEQKLRKDDQGDLKLPQAFRGTNIPGEIIFLDGELELNRNLRRVFDYFLSVRGSISQEDIDALFAEYLDKRFNRDEKSRVLNIWQKYLELLDAESNLSLDLGGEWSHDKLVLIMNERRALRDEILGAEMREGFFAADERYEALQLAIMLKKESGAAIDAKAMAFEYLKPEEAEARLKTHSYLRLKELKKESGSWRGEVISQLAEGYGEEAVQRLEESEIRKLHWQEKRKMYLAIKESLVLEGASREDLESLLRTETEDFLQDHELRRMQALDTLEL